MTTKRYKLTEERSFFKPFSFPWAYDSWLKHEQAHWLHTEVPMMEDVKDWKKKIGYHKSSLAETCMFRYKRIFSGHVWGRKISTQTYELRLRGKILKYLIFHSYRKIKIRK
jgi:hypothetical protein